MLDVWHTREQGASAGGGPPRDGEGARACCCRGSKESGAATREAFRLTQSACYRPARADLLACRSKVPPFPLIAEARPTSCPRTRTSMAIIQDLPTELLFHILDLAFDDPFDKQRASFLRQSSLVAWAWRMPSQWLLAANMTFRKWSDEANEARRAHLAQVRGGARVVRLDFLHDSVSLLEEVLDAAQGFEQVSLMSYGQRLPDRLLSHPHLARESPRASTEQQKSVPSADGRKSMQLCDASRLICISRKITACLKPFYH